MSMDTMPKPEEVIARYYRRIDIARKFSLSPDIVRATQSDELAIVQTYVDENLDTLIRLAKADEEPVA